MSTFLDALHSGRVLLMDGAMSTELQRVGLKPDENAAAWNILHPKRVRAVHQAYRAAGAEVLLSNTFLICSPSLNNSLAPVLEPSAHVWPAWQAARKVTGNDSPPYRLAAIGPVAGNISTREFDQFEQLWSCWYANKLFDALLLETCSSPRVYLAIRAMRKAGDLTDNNVDLPLLLSLTFHRDAGGKVVTFSGHSPEWFARRARKYGVAALGVNCGLDISIADCAEIIRRYRQVTDLPLFARPNAGTPKKVRGRWIYPLTPPQMAESLPELLEAGVSMVGGCCGTTPEHIAALRPVVDRWNAR